MTREQAVLKIMDSGVLTKAYEHGYDEAYRDYTHIDFVVPPRDPGALALEIVDLLLPDAPDMTDPSTSPRSSTSQRASR